MKYERMLPGEIERVRAETPIAVLPWGALEWHGYHQAIGLDGLKAQGFADAVAERVGGISLPVLYCGHQTLKPYMGFGHTIEISEETMRLLARDFVSQLAEEDFKVIVIISGHGNPRQLELLEEGAAPSAEATGVKVLVIADGQAIDDPVYPLDHAAKWETSILSYLAPELVDLGKYRSDIPAKEQGVLGEDPIENASPELGEAAFKEIVENIAQQALKLLEAE